jgi:hypothetical protein
MTWVVPFNEKGKSECRVAGAGSLAGRPRPGVVRNWW